MKIYAQLNSDGFCYATIETEGLIQNGWIEVSSHEYCGKAWNGSTWEDYAHTTIPKRILTKLEYMDRFTDPELEAIYTAAKSSVAVEVWLEKFKQAADINLDDERTIAGLNKLKDASILTTQRVAEILA